MTTTGQNMTTHNKTHERNRTTNAATVYKKTTKTTYDNINNERHNLQKSANNTKT